MLQDLGELNMNCSPQQGTKNQTIKYIYKVK